MADQMVSIDPYPNPEKAGLDNFRKVTPNLLGSRPQRLVALIEMNGGTAPPGAPLKELERIWEEMERRQAKTGGLTKQDLLDSRGRTAWNKLAEQWAKSGVRKGRELPMHLCRTHGYSTEDCNAIDEELHSIDIDVERKANTPPWQLADDVIVGNLKRFLDAFNALEERVVALEAQRRGPPYNALVDVTPRLAVNNGD